jgi:serine/threonine-protein kinase OSR1/STK39
VPPVGAEWPTEAAKYDLIGKIGQGAFASVWRAATTVTLPNAPASAAASGEKKQQSEECAIKILNLDHVDSNLSEIRLEVQAMRLSSHPNVLSCFTAFVHSTDLWLVTQLMRKGSSLHCIQGARRRLRRENKMIKMEEHILFIMHQTLLGLQYIHENGQIHRDIKAGNILLDSNGDVRIADFGVSGWLVNAGTQQEKAKTFVGTPCWMVGVEF